MGAFRQCASPWVNGSPKKEYMQAFSFDEGEGYWLTFSTVAFTGTKYLKSIYNNDPNFGVGEENAPVWFIWERASDEKIDGDKQWKITTERKYYPSKEVHECNYDGNMWGILYCWWERHHYAEYLDYEEGGSLYFKWSGDYSNAGRWWIAADLTPAETKAIQKSLK